MNFTVLICKIGRAHVWTPVTIRSRCYSNWRHHLPGLAGGYFRNLELWKKMYPIMFNGKQYS